MKSGLETAPRTETDRVKESTLKIGPAVLDVRETENGSERRQGLLGEEEAPDWGLILRGAPLIHTFGMKFPIDILWIRGGRVVKISSSVPHRRLLGSLAWTCLELPAGESERLGIRKGDLVTFSKGGRGFFST